MSGEIIFYDDDGKPIFSKESSLIDEEFDNTELVTVIGGEQLPEEGVQELDPVVDFRLR